MFKVIQRYLAAQFIPPFIISLLFFVCFLLTFQLFKITSVFINKGVSFSTGLLLIGHIGVSFVPAAVPLSAFLSTVFTLNRFSDDSEIIAMRSFGTSRWQMFMPFLYLGILISLTVFAAFQNLIPYSKRQFTNTIIQLTSKGLLNEIKAEKFFTDIPNVTLFAERVNNSGNKLENIFLHLKSSAREEQIIMAERGVLIKQKDGEWGIPSIRLNFMDGNMVKIFSNKNDVEKYLFSSYDFPALSGNYQPGFITKDSMRTNKELWQIMKEREASGAIDLDYRKTALEYWYRINIPFQTLLFILIGFSFGIRQGRGISKNTMGMALFFVTLYYILFFLFVSLAQRGKMDVAIASFIPTIVLTVITTYYYRKLDWVS